MKNSAGEKQPYGMQYNHLATWCTEDISVKKYNHQALLGTARPAWTSGKGKSELSWQD